MHTPLLIFCILPYVVIIVLFIAGWFRLKAPAHSVPDHEPWVSILVPVKNEETTLPALLGDLMNQTYTRFEVIVIDDHSDDDTANVAAEFKNQNVRVIRLNARSGKKAALLEGLQVSKGEYILTTDADCRLPENWIKSMMRFFTGYPGHLVIGPVFFKEKKGWFNRFQQMEFLSLIASAAGSAGIKRPVLCNGANLGGPRDLFLQSADVYKSEIASGDDIFLMLKLKKEKVPFVFAKDPEAAVETEGASGTLSFLQQRSRWTYKSRFYTDADIIVVALVVLFTNVFLLGWLLYSLFHPQFFTAFLLSYSVKCFVDYMLLYYVARFFKRKEPGVGFVLHQLLYIFYVSFTGIAGHFSSGKWKGRKGHKLGLWKS